MERGQAKTLKKSSFGSCVWKLEIDEMQTLDSVICLFGCHKTKTWCVWKYVGLR